MKTTLLLTTLAGAVFAALLVLTGILNLLLVHPVPGIAYLLVALLYLPLTNAYLLQRFGFTVPAVVKIGLGILIFFFTFGVSDLGDMIDKL